MYHMLLFSEGFKAQHIVCVRIDAQHIQELPDLLLRGVVAIQVDDTQQRHQFCRTI